MMTNFDFTKEDRKNAWDYLISQLEAYYANTSSIPVSPRLNKEEIKNFVCHTFDVSQHYDTAIDHVVKGLKQFAVHTPHPMYYGLFNPRSNFPGILADTITATFNPQIAAWSHSPFAAEVENKMLIELGKKFGYNEQHIDGVFTSGGAEANLTALLCALNDVIPDHAEN
ncbi:MAG: pyridoxal-dependent decarboxylase, partial [Bacteroidota bacterium]